MKNVHTLLAKNFLTPLGLSARMSAADAPIQTKIYGSDIACNSINSFKWINERYNKNSLTTWRIRITNTSNQWINWKSSKGTKKRISYSVFRNISC